MKKSKLLFGMYSYSSIFSSPSMQQPRSLTRFLCCNLAISVISFLNSSRPCPDLLESLFTAISSPPGSTPWSKRSDVSMAHSNYPFCFIYFFNYYLQLISTEIHLVDRAKSPLSELVLIRKVACSSCNTLEIEQG